MDLAEARRVLGVTATAPWSDVRAAYRTRIGVAHPDRAGGDTARAAVLNDAYTSLARARRAGTATGTQQAPVPARPPAPRRGTGRRPAAATRTVPAEVLDGHTLHLPLSPDEAFARIVDACHHLGSVTYVDRSCAILEALVRVEGEGTCSFVVTLEPRGGGTSAFCTLESIERVASPPVDDVVAALVALL